VLIVANIISQHAEEAAMLWLLRHSATQAPHYSLADLVKLDRRIEAHIDGLRIAGEAGWAACEEQLATNEVGEVFAASLIAFESGQANRIAKVAAVIEADSVLEQSMASALVWLPLKQAEPHLNDLLRSEVPAQLRVGLAAAAGHRRHPGVVLSNALRSTDSAVRACALDAAGQLPDSSLDSDIRHALRDADAKYRLAAAWAGALRGINEATSVLQEIAEASVSAEAAGMAVRRMAPADALNWHKRLSGQPKLARPAIVAAGCLGDPALVPWLISLMGQLPLARLAGEAFTMITGVGLAYRDLERKPPEDFNAGPTDDPKDENVEMDPDDNLPWPEPALVANWWQKNQGQFQNGTRYLCGKPMATEWLQQVLRDGYQRQRTAAALELAIRQPGKPLFNVKAPGFRQIQLLGKPGPPLR